MNKKIISTSKAPSALGPYSQAVWVNNLLFLSGQIPLNHMGELVVGTIEEQTKQVFSNINAIIKESGGTLDDVIKLSVFVTDLVEFYCNILKNINYIAKLKKMIMYFILPHVDG